MNEEEKAVKSIFNSLKEESAGGKKGGKNSFGELC
jgi:hypothetical protein